MSVQSSSTALLPAHLEVISQCWDEALSKAPIAERVRLISFLIQLRPHFPSWKGAFEKYLTFKISDSYSLSVLSWDVIIETLMEYDDDSHGGHTRSSIAGVSSRLSVDINYIDFKISMTRLIVHQMLKRPSSEYVFI